MEQRTVNDRPLEAGAFEIATLGIQLAALRKQREPALADAVNLLIKAHVEAVKIVNFNQFGETTAIWHDLSPLKGDNTLPLNERRKTFEGADLISEPDEPYPGEGLELLDALKRISGEKNKERCWQYRNRFARYVYKSKTGQTATDMEEIKIWGRLKEYFDEAERIEYPATFWAMARNLAPFCPRFREYYPATAIPSVRNPNRIQGKFASLNPIGRLKKRDSEQNNVDIQELSILPQKSRGPQGEGYME
jgi:hypothetical protein